MFKNLMQKLVSVTIALSVALSGLSFVPVFASADNGLHLGIESELGVSVGAETKINKDKNRNHDEDERRFNIQDEAFISATKTANITFHDAVKDANTTYKTTKKSAKNQFQASVKTATNQTDRIAALKTYLSSMLAAFKVKVSAIEAAFQVFIDTGFDQAPVANAQNVTVSKNSSVNITLTGSDPEGSTLTYMVTTNPAHGTLSGTAPNLTYTPTANFTGTDSFTFKVNDGSLDSTLTTVLVTVNP